MDWKDVVKTVAPWIGTALAGPLGGLAVEAATSALGLSDKTSEGLKQALSGMSAQDMLALKNADYEFQRVMQDMGYRNLENLEAIAAGDRDSARKMQTENKSIMPALLTTVIGAAFIGCLFALFSVDIPEPNKDLLVYMTGQLGGAFGVALAFWFGTTRSSSDKTALIAKAGAVR